MHFALYLLAALAVLGAPAPADANAARSIQRDWFSSIYTPEGIELRADERVFALYALLNAMGYDEGTVVRQHPLPRRQFHPVRAKIRQVLLAADPEVRREANAFFDANPWPIERYLAHTLQGLSAAAPQGKQARGRDDLKGLDTLLDAARGRWKLDELLAEAQADYRRALRAYLPIVDGPLQRARKLIRVSDDGARPVVVMNLLEAENRIAAVAAGGEVAILVGPSDRPDLERLVAEYARVVLEPAVGGRAQSGWGGGQALLREAQLAGATETTVSAYAAALFSRAVALRALDAPDSAYEAMGRKGYFGVKDIAQRLDEQRPINTWTLEALQRAETRRPAKK